MVTTTDRLRVEVAGGAIRGVSNNGIDSWLGIPYARAPIGRLRWRAPGPVQPWAGDRDCRRFGTMSAQLHWDVRTGHSPARGSGEDCLTVNVHSPSHRSAASALPVMVFIHGGGYSAGSSREFSEHGRAFIGAGPIVYVSFNYRLGPLGYLDFTRYSSTARVFERNLGLRDQLAALRWVHNNIGQFGGDPAKVTIFGESAGGNAVTTLMTTPSAEGLFAGAIAQSSPAGAAYPPELAARWARDFVDILAADLDFRVDPDDSEQVGALLDGAPVAPLLHASRSLQIRTPDEYPGKFCLAPVVDGDLYPEHPLEAFRSGRAHRVPLIIGTNDREGSLFRGRIDIIPRTPQRIDALFRSASDGAQALMNAAYPALPTPRAAADFAGDYGFWFPCTRIADFHSRFAPVWVYRFDVAPTLLRLLGLDATHGVEMFTLFHELAAPLPRAITALGGKREYVAAGDRMRANWVSFATNGAPRHPWPRYGGGQRSTLIIDAADHVEDDPRSERREAWDAFLSK